MHDEFALITNGNPADKTICFLTDDS